MSGFSHTSSETGPEAPLATMRGDRITVRGFDLADELIGQVSFTEMLLLDLTGEPPSPTTVRMVDAVLVALMEHGITPSTLATRLALDGAPESLQGAVAAGLLAVGSRFLGVIEDAAHTVQTVARDGETLGLEAAAGRRVDSLQAAGLPVPGLGHNLHGHEDPRVAALLRVAEKERLSDRHVRALRALHAAANDRLGKELIVNAAGAAAAVLLDLGHPPGQVRGFALVTRCAGLFAHAVDELKRPLAREVWERESERFRE